MPHIIYRRRDNNSPWIWTPMTKQINEDLIATWSNSACMCLQDYTVPQLTHTRTLKIIFIEDEILWIIKHTEKIVLLVKALFKLSCIWNIPVCQEKTTWIIGSSKADITGSKFPEAGIIVLLCVSIISRSMEIPSLTAGGGERSTATRGG